MNRLKWDYISIDREYKVLEVIGEELYTELKSRDGTYTVQLEDDQTIIVYSVKPNLAIVAHLVIYDQNGIDEQSADRVDQFLRQEAEVFGAIVYGHEPVSA